MNNLLRTLTESHVKSVYSDTDLKLLLSAVKEIRSHDAVKLADAFYDSLEGLLHDLRTVTMDNRDAEAFLKPVSKTDVPDYYDVIAHPMDLQTMLKKVKQKQYKSKKEFKDDLDLIWGNCLKYNATENHPLRQCATRLKVKAERLLKNITDWKERADPNIPADLTLVDAASKSNGVGVNGHSRYLSPAAVKSPGPGKAVPVTPASRKARRNVPFEETPAIVRTANGMAAFAALDRELASQSSLYASDEVRSLRSRLSDLVVPVSDDDTDGSETMLLTADVHVGSKRKLNGFVDGRPRKRARTQVLEDKDKDVAELWWDATQSDELLGNGYPTLAYPSSEAVPDTESPKPITDLPQEAVRRRRRKKTVLAANTLLYHMNSNIRTLRRVRTTHAKFSALSQTAEEGAGAGAMIPPELPSEDLEDVIDERPWKPMGSGIEIGEQNANACLHWTSSKVLEHAGFQGTSKVALDVLAGVASEYLLNVGRTIRFLCDKYAKKMTPEEIVLHTLFESGTTRIHELERYIKDDVIRYGSRLAELEKKLASAYREATTEEAWDDDALFQNAEDGEEEGQFVMGNFAESFGEDFLGLRELGIAEEFGLSSLTIPKKLLKGKGKQGLAEGPATAKPSEPPPPFPPPPPFVHLDSKMVENQIGLLRPYYQQRFATLSIQTSSSNPSVPASQGFDAFVNAIAPISQPPVVPNSDMAVLPFIPDDLPSLAHTKIGPLGQILKSAPITSTSKKKPKGKTPAAPVALMHGVSEGEVPQDFAASSPLPIPEPIKRGRPPGALNKKKGGKGPDPFPPAVMASA